MARTFTREEFYELVWAKPMTHLAKEFALSDVALHKICRKHDIPNPPLGWWAKKAAGKKVKQTPLPKVEGGDGKIVTIAVGELARESPTLAAVREQARILASESASSESAPSHPIIERTIAQLRKAKATEQGIVATSGSGLIRCEVTAPSIDRLAIILPRVVHAAQQQGFHLTSTKGAASFRSETEDVGVSITETIKREKHVLTEAERTKEEAWEAKRERVAKRNDWDSYTNLWSVRPDFPEWDYHPTGKLSLEFEGVYLWGRGISPRRSFRDAKTQRLENMASDIAVGLAVLAAAKTEERLKHEAAQRRAEEERRRREEAARVQYIEERRAAGLDEILSEMEELDRLRRLMAILTAETRHTPSPRVATFLAWARGHLAEREASLSAQGLEDRFAEQQLFGDTDDHEFNSSRWY